MLDLSVQVWTEDLGNQIYMIEINKFSTIVFYITLSAAFGIVDRIDGFTHARLVGRNGPV